MGLILPAQWERIFLQHRLVTNWLRTFLLFFSTYRIKANGHIFLPLLLHREPTLALHASARLNHPWFPSDTTLSHVCPSHLPYTPPTVRGSPGIFLALFHPLPLCCTLCKSPRTHSSHWSLAACRSWRFAWKTISSYCFIIVLTPLHKPHAKEAD